MSQVDDNTFFKNVKCNRGQKNKIFLYLFKNEESRSKKIKLIKISISSRIQISPKTSNYKK